MNLFGWIYLILSVIGAFVGISEIGEPREPRTAASVSFSILFSGLLFWGLYVWGIRA
jgi:hypothetical protein